ncbi:hypothetical protein ATN89_21625 [Comamonas thiooxydans]|uniref:hypothetical protein n=1 Tax=Comamonas thiooxydans TaxID=363952 RepID=UPI0007C4568E|nr:hypothetical protein [Comamonas thiooxydans]OAD82098.1 hypothetical protein ATN89_21625 [Comamonas thiooxydans]
MLDRVPVPTDNIYKFIALFSVVALIFSMWALLNTQTSTNEVVFKTLPEIESLKKIKVPTHEQAVSLALLERKLEIAKSDRRALSCALYAVFAVAAGLASYGFGKWHKEIQPLVDAQSKAQLEILQLQIEKLRLENQKLAESLKGDEPPLVAASPPQPSVLAQVVRALLTR